MIYDRIFIDPESDRVILDAYASSDTQNNPKSRDAVLILPGGGYGFCSKREAEPIALAFLSRGINAFVLYYRVGEEGDVYPRQLIDASRAMLYIRQNAEKYGIDPGRVFVLGFSAGGHLAGSLAYANGDPDVLCALGATKDQTRPNGAILCYPVVTAKLPTHEGSFTRLSGKPFAELTDSERELYTLENKITPDSPPTFIWHTAQDKAVPPFGSLALASELVRNGVLTTLRLYPTGPHGLSLANRITRTDTLCDNTVAARWIDEAVEFLNLIK